MAGAVRLPLLIGLLLTLLLHLAAGQQFVQPPSSDDSNANPNPFDVGKEIKLKWKCDYDHVNVYLWKDQTDSEGTKYMAQVLDKESNPGKATFTPEKDVLEDNHDAKFHFQVAEYDPQTEEETGNSFDSASFDIKPGKASPTASASATTSAAPTSTASEATPPPNTNNPVLANMSTGTTIGVSVAFACSILILAVLITLWIRHRNRRRHSKYLEDEEKRLSSWPSDVQQPFPRDPRPFRHTLWAPEYRNGSSPPIASPIRAKSRRSEPLPRRLNGLSKKSLPPLPRS